MKAGSRGLEIEVYLNKDEASKLQKELILNGTLLFDNTGLPPEQTPIKRDIPFTIILDEKYNDAMGVIQIPPKVYFGTAKEFFIVIYQNHLENLLETKHTGDKFYTSGKISFYLED